MVPHYRWHLSCKIWLTINFLHMDLTNLVYLGSCFSKSLIFVWILKIITTPCHCIQLFLSSRNPLQILLKKLLHHFNIACSVTSVLQLVLIAPTTPYELCQRPEHHNHLKSHQYKRHHLLFQHQPQQKLQ